MFSISSAEFTELPTFVEKVNTVSSTDDGASDTGAHELRSWCGERGFLLHFSKTPSGVFYTLKYDRAKLTDEQYGTVGRFRSVVFDSKGEICCIAPPKMLKITDEMKSLPVNSEGGYLTAEELVEGIMVNLFWRGAGAGEGEGEGAGGKWYIATKSCVGEVSFDHILEAAVADNVVPSSSDATSALDSTDSGDKPAFQKLSIQEVLRRRICDVLSLLPGGLDAVPKQYCYSFVVQHPKNQIVNLITVPKLYLVAVYELSKLDAGSGEGAGVNAIRIHRDIFSSSFAGTVSHMPSSLTCVADETDASSATLAPHTVEDYCRMYASSETRSVSLPGVVFQDMDTGFCYKMRNPKYESVKKRKGMEQKLMAQYLQLRKDRAIDEYLKYHPQHSRAFHQFRDRLHEYTQRLYDAYIEHYVKKNAKPLKEYDRELKTHMYKLHYDVFLATMKETGTFVTKHTVINYVNNLAAAQQLACLNTAGAGAGTTAGAGDIGTTGGDDSTVSRRRVLPSFQGKRIERSTITRDGSGAGFRSARPSRGRTTPSLTVQIPSADESMKGIKASGSVKVQNQYAGLNTDD